MNPDAKDPSPGEQTAKPSDFFSSWILRQPRLAGGLGLLVLALAGALLVLWLKETRARKAATVELESSEARVKVLLDHQRQTLESIRWEMEGKPGLAPFQQAWFTQLENVLDQLARQRGKQAVPSVSTLKLSLSLGELYLAAGLVEKASKELEQAGQNAQALLSSESASRDVEAIVAQITLHLGDLDAGRGDFKQAIYRYDRVFQSSQRQYNANPEDPRFALPLIRVCARLGRLELGENKVTEARDFFTFALEVMDFLGPVPQGWNLEEKMDLQSRLGEAWLGLGDREKALEYLEKALSTALGNAEASPNRHMAKILVTLAREQLAGFHLRLGDLGGPEKALELFHLNEQDYRKMALANPDRGDYQRSLAFSCLQEAEACLLLGKAVRVVGLLREAEQIFSAQPDLEQQHTRSARLRCSHMRITQAIQEGNWKTAHEEIEAAAGLLEKWKGDYPKEALAREKAGLELDKKLVSRLQEKGVHSPDLTTGLEPGLGPKLELYRSRVLAREGKTVEAEKVLEPYLKKENKTSEEEVQLARTYAILAGGSSPSAPAFLEKSFKHLRQAIRGNPGLLVDLHLKPEFLSMRKDPQWAALIQGK